MPDFLETTFFMQSDARRIWQSDQGKCSSKGHRAQSVEKRRVKFLSHAVAPRRLLNVNGGFRRMAISRSAMPFRSIGITQDSVRPRGDQPGEILCHADDALRHL